MRRRRVLSSTAMAHHATRRIRRGFTLVEVMIVVVIMAILAAIVIPSFTDNTKAAKQHTAEFNLRELRSQIELYRQHHDGKLPSATLAELLVKSNSSGAAGTTAAFPFGPYCSEIPVNPLTDSAMIRIASSNPPTAASGAVDAGWLYYPGTGGIWIDDPDYFQE